MVNVRGSTVLNLVKFFVVCYYSVFSASLHAQNCSLETDCILESLDSNYVSEFLQSISYTEEQQECLLIDLEKITGNYILRGKHGPRELNLELIQTERLPFVLRIKGLIGEGMGYSRPNHEDFYFGGHQKLLQNLNGAKANHNNYEYKFAFFDGIELRRFSAFDLYNCASTNMNSAGRIGTLGDLEYTITFQYNKEDINMTITKNNRSFHYTLSN